MIISFAHLDCLRVHVYPQHFCCVLGPFLVEGKPAIMVLKFDVRWKHIRSKYASRGNEPDYKVIANHQSYWPI